MIDQVSISAKLEALLFYSGGEETVKNLCAYLEIDEHGLQNSVDGLQNGLKDRGVTIIKTDNLISLRVAPSCASFIESIDKKSRESDIGKAGLEILAILIYRGNSSKSEIDYIRGVNSATTLRALLVRGLIERSIDGKAYLITPDSLAYLGIAKIGDAPEFEMIKGRIEEFERQSA